MLSDRRNNLVLVFDNDGKFFTTIHSNSSNNNIPTKPCGVAIDSSGKVLVLDKEAGKIYLFVSPSNSTTLHTRKSIVQSKTY